MLVFGGTPAEAEAPRGPAVSVALGRLSPGLLALLLGVFVEACLKFTPLANPVCVSHRCGKTTLCQVFAALADQRLYSVSCHLHMETSDFLGGLRPARQKPDDKVCSEQVMMRLFI